ncbi:hypothetical protein HMI55_003960 [Coelomomyces lativittatus]|nr:hypothetical protein HMI55_003960 [Coelomomyces lativittatus]
MLDECQRGVLSHFVNDQIKGLTDMQQLNNQRLEMTVRCIDPTSFSNLNDNFFLKFNLIPSVPTSVPLKNVSFLDEIKERRELHFPVEYFSEFIATEKKIIFGRKIMQFVVSMTDHYLTSYEIRNFFAPHSASVNEDFENKHFSLVRPIPGFISRFFFQGYEVIPSIWETKTLLRFPYNVSLDNSLSFYFRFERNPSFQGPYQCTILGRLSYSGKYSFTTFVECDQDQCEEPMYSKFFIHRVPRLTQVSQLHKAKLKLFVYCKDHSKNTPHPDVEILMDWHIFVNSNPPIQGNLISQTDMVSWVSDTLFHKKEPSLFAITSIGQRGNENVGLLFGTRINATCNETLCWRKPHLLTDKSNFIAYLKSGDKSSMIEGSIDKSSSEEIIEKITDLINSIPLNISSKLEKLQSLKNTSLINNSIGNSDDTTDKQINTEDLSLDHSYMLLFVFGFFVVSFFIFLIVIIVFCRHAYSLLHLLVIGSERKRKM